MTSEVLLSLAECIVIITEFPPLRKKDINAAVELRLPRLYPHSLDGKVWDTLKAGDQTLILLLDADKLIRLREKHGSSLVINCTVQLIPDRETLTEENRPCVYRFLGNQGKDLFFMRGRRLEQAAHFSPNGDTAPVIKSFFGESGPHGESFSIRELIKHRKKPLFRKKKKLIPVPFLPLFLFLPVLIYLILFYKENQRLQNLVFEQNLMIDQKQKTLPPREIDYPWEENLALLKEAIPSDPYLIISALFNGFKERGTIHSLTIQDSNIHLEARSKDSLLIMEDLKARGILTDMTLHQIRREGKEEIFSLSGRCR